MIAEKVGLRKRPDRTQVGRPMPERDLTLREVLLWPTLGTRTRWDPLDEAWPVQPTVEGRVRPAPCPVHIEIVIDPAQARVLIELLRHIFAGPPEAKDPACVGQDRTLPATRAFDLTPREEETLKQMIEGKSNRQIALELAIATATVKCHVSNILSKMGAESRTEAVAIALQHQLLAG